MKFAPLSLIALALGALATPTPGPEVSEVETRDILSDLGDLLDVVQHVQVIITLDTLVTNLASVVITLKNDLIFPLHINRIQSKAGVNGTTYAEFDATFTNFTIPPFGKTANSTVIPNVNLTQGAIASLDIIPLGVIDIQKASLDLTVALIPIKGFPYAQTQIPTTYDLALS
ncbi:hypothetical protein EXIGLDRAFT_414040 [Exidia glandulosa HHB12029]|uniref:Late embryogenesis abundant protein LEA-2 subgroup domain-containing protein n=1 Tax=Exidia glandulosa HHB12029 TaxID=1314781 RepID=A0A165PQK4_EXIGL|nr:hypothetical protein EXIGLDRAFT_414040 [Exidia glandulosa HHB12029]